MTGRKRGVKVNVEEIWRNKVIKKETNGGGGGGGGSGGPKLRDQGRALEGCCGGLVGGNEEHGGVESEQERGKENLRTRKQKTTQIETAKGLINTK